MRTGIATGSAAICVLLGVVGASLSIGGPLDPPAGPITSTYKTLTEIEPRVAICSANTPGDAQAVFKIAQPGSYYLTCDVKGAAGKNGLEIACDNVTLDLNGYQLVGGPDSLKGICVSATGSRTICIKNGTVRDWGQEGVCTINVSGSLLMEVRAWRNGSIGIDAGPSAIIKNCTAQQNLMGILVGNNGMLFESTVQENNGIGFMVGNGAIMTGCTSGQNTAEGVVAGTGSTITGCSSRANILDGFRLDYGCTITSSSAAFNGRDGFFASGSGVSIRGCTAEANTIDGIRALSDCVIKDNTCDSNGYGSGDGAGIHTLGTHNRVEANHVSDSDRGIQVEGTANLIIRNTLSGNAIQVLIPPGNLTGTVVSTETALNAANGNSNVVY